MDATGPMQPLGSSGGGAGEQQQQNMLHQHGRGRDGQQSVSCWHWRLRSCTWLLQLRCLLQRAPLAPEYSTECRQPVAARRSRAIDIDYLFFMCCDGNRRRWKLAPAQLSCRPDVIAGQLGPVTTWADWLARLATSVCAGNVSDKYALVAVEAAAL